MIEMLDHYDKRIAAGLLARAALALKSGESGLSASPVVENEGALRASLIAQARARLGIEPDDQSPEVIERIGSYFDEESERLIGEPHTTAAVQRLIERGDFPSDLYEVRVIPNISEFLGKAFEQERTLIERTIRMPLKEQHFGPPTTESEPYLISLFARPFKTPFPYRDFMMLVAGQRGEKRIFQVHQAWRLYASKVPTEGSADLVDLLRRFADVYGADIEVDGRRGHFFLTAETVAPPEIRVELGGKKTIMVTGFVQIDPATHHRHAALVVSVDLNRYRHTLENMDSKTIF
jgi:hypothetical protein